MKKYLFNLLRAGVAGAIVLFMADWANEAMVQFINPEMQVRGGWSSLLVPVILGFVLGSGCWVISQLEQKNSSTNHDKSS